MLGKLMIAGLFVFAGVYETDHGANPLRIDRDIPLYGRPDVDNRCVRD
jgi:hypothetical protein